MPKGRPKGSKNSVLSNLNYWRFVIKADQYKPFIEKGNKRQKMELEMALKYMKKAEKELFNKVDGEKILEKLKGGD